jgi:hypothetical protein
MMYFGRIVVRLQQSELGKQDNYFVDCFANFHLHKEPLINSKMVACLMLEVTTLISKYMCCDKCTAIYQPHISVEPPTAVYFLGPLLTNSALTTLLPATPHIQISDHNTNAHIFAMPINQMKIHK